MSGLPEPIEVYLQIAVELRSKVNSLRIGVFFMIEEISATELKRRMDAGEDIQLIDVRQPDENAFAKIPGARLIPLGDVVRRMKEINPGRETVIHCKMGGRSAKAIEVLKQAGFTGELKNLKGGITAWSNEVDPKVPKY